ncbi:conserved protein of unknown function [Rhodovastum atsumiense]|uniref:Uncharacterized protein n=1 Tax=Rhodovastum atsumiense TaxID=504468 RepID=A0A5M6IIM8_9PROT|nr:hypothetical protein [Rhodovastum atsumiense]KAA5607992.1 hypothetical protein F1189_31190 [Rhodovastum atsumiense]CAH2602601.1 conserved protein of unknown function [Rhodovastum atsumiense]
MSPVPPSARAPSAAGRAVAVTATASLALPPLSAALAAAMELARPRSYPGRDPDEAPVMLPPHPVPAAARAEAAAALARMQAVPRIGHAQMQRWLATLLAAGLGGAPTTEAAIADNALGMVLVCGHLPETVLGEAALRHGLREWDWWPVPARVLKVLEAVGAGWLAREQALQAVLAAPVAAEAERPAAEDGQDRPPPGAAERAAVRACVAAWCAEVAARAADPAKTTRQRQQTRQETA